MVDSLCEVCEEALKLNMDILVEPIDYKTTKNSLLGPIKLVSETIDKVYKNYENIGIVFDTAHIALNDEDILSALETTKIQIKRIHIIKCRFR